MNMLINHFIIASRAYSQQSPTCTRVNNLVYIFSIQHSWCLTLMESQCWSCLLVEEVMSVSCTIQFFMFFAKTLTSPNLTLLYHLMINLLSSHDNSHHHMMNIIYLVKSETFVSLYAYMTYDQSKELSHSMCIWNSLNLETKFLKPKYYIFQSLN